MNLIPSFKLAAIAAGVAFVLGAGSAWRVTSWQYQAREAKAVRAAAAAERKAQRSVIEDLRRQITHAQEASSGYQNELAELRTARAAVPARTVRMCVNPVSAPTDPNAAGTAARGSDGAPAGAGELPPRAGRDIGPELYGLADRCDDIAAQLRALQEWVRRVSAAK